MKDRPVERVTIKPESRVTMPKATDRQWMDAPEPPDGRRPGRRAWWRTVARHVFLRG